MITMLLKYLGVSPPGRGFVFLLKSFPPGENHQTRGDFFFLRGYPGGESTPGGMSKT